jgi:membrane protease YdiL (CAAX protease family)
MREPLKLTKAHDPLLVLLALLALLGVGLTLGTRLKAPPVPAGTTRALTALELQLQLGRKLEAVQPGISKKFIAAGRDLTAAWDRAAWAVDAREAGDTALADRLREPAPGGPEGVAFAKAWAAAYDDGDQPASLPAPLKGTRAGALLENRLRARQGLPALPIPQPDLALLAGLGLLISLLFFTGLATAVILLATAKRPGPPQPQWRMEGRGALLVLLGWLVGFFILNTAAGLALHRLPQGRLWALPLGYAMHATFGVWLLMRVEGLTFRGLIARVVPGPRAGRAFAWAPAFLGLAVLAMFCAAMAWAPFIKGHANPQQEVQELIAGAQGWPVQAALFLTIAGLAPCFEELLFRGFLLPWAGERWGAAWGLAASSLLFGFIHLQPWALPLLATLGFVLGLAARRGGSLWTSIAVHAFWNGSIFVLLKAL